jgi:hypothetical protein
MAARPFFELIQNFFAEPSKWQLVKSESVASTNVRNSGGTSTQELFRHADTGEELVRHTLLKADGSLFQPPHFRPSWK